jgi:peptide/nickel transport system permease protein
MRFGRPGIWRFLLRRFTALIVLLLIISVVTFALFTIGPSDPARLTCKRGCTEQTMKDNRAALGLDEPVVTRYLEYMKGIVAGRDMGPPSARYHCDFPCFGKSFSDKQFVWDKITRALPYTVSIALGAALLWLVVGVAAGVIAGLRKGSWIDKAAVSASSVAMAIPLPVVGLGLIWLLNLKLNWFSFFDQKTPLPWSPGGPLQWMENFLLVWITLALLYAAAYVRLARANTVETMGEDYIRTARAKGLPNRTVVVKHGLRASITPILTMFGLDLAGLIGGAVVAEQIFSVPGLGKMTIDAETNGDLPVIMAVMLITAFFIITANVIVDILYAVIDPRVELS